MKELSSQRTRWATKGTIVDLTGFEQIVERTGGSKTALLSLQLVAWQKLDQAGQVPATLSYERLIESRLSRMRMYALISRFAEKFEWFTVDESSVETLPVEHLSMLVKAGRDLDTELSYRSILRILNRGHIRFSKPHLPVETVTFMVRCAGLRRRDSVLCCFDNATFLAFEAVGMSDNVTVVTDDHLSLACLLNILLGTNVKVVSTDSDEGANALAADYDVVLDASNPEGDILDRLYSIIPKFQRCCVAVVPTSFLFRRSPSFLDLRREMVIERYLHAVITASNSSVLKPSSEVALLVLGANCDQVGFGTTETDESGKLATIADDVSRGTNLSGLLSWVDPETIIANAFVLSPNRYLTELRRPTLASFLRSPIRRLPLGELVELSRPPSNIRVAVPVDGTSWIYEVSVTDIDENGIVSWPPGKKVALNSQEQPLTNGQMLWRGDILICIKGAVGEIGIVEEDGEGAAIAGGSFITARLRSDEVVDSRVLFHFLRSAIGVGLLESVATGSPVKFLSIKELRRVPIAVPPRAVQKNILSVVNKIRDREIQIEEIRSNIEQMERQLIRLFLK